MWRSFHHLIRVVDLIIGEAAAVPGANKQKNMGAERKSQRALGDIGNMVTVCGVDGKPRPQVSRPLTRY